MSKKKEMAESAEVKKAIEKAQIAKWKEWENDLRAYNQSRKFSIKTRVYLETVVAKEAEKSYLATSKTVQECLYNCQITKEAFTEYESTDRIDLFFPLSEKDWENFRNDYNLNQFFVYFKCGQKNCSKRAYIQSCEIIKEDTLIKLTFAPNPCESWQ